jgi:hypothetical protein
MSVRNRTTVFRWDLDKTYLVSHFESLRQLLRVPFEKAEDKVAVPGVAALIKGLRRAAVLRHERPVVSFLSASPPQIGNAIRAKLEMDGIEYERITFKDQMSHIVRGRFDALREQIGYKLEQLLESALESGPATRELLFGDDWESDPLVYSLYADLVEGRLDPGTVPPLLDRAGVNKLYVYRVEELLARLGESHARPVVDGIFILRQRPASAAQLAAFGPRLEWFDNYFQCALKLVAYRLLDLDGLLRVAEESALSPATLADSFDRVARRGPVRREHLSQARRVLESEGLMERVERGRLLLRITSRLRSLLGRPTCSLPVLLPLPDYESLMAPWSHRGRKEFADGQDEDDDEAEDAQGAAGVDDDR